MIEAGVVRSSKKGGKPYAFFRDRIMFPVPDRRGRIVAFGGRVLPEDLRPVMSGDYTPPKYMNSSDTALFDKGSMLYGEPHARQAAVDGQTLIVVEGYMDVIACSQAGFGGAVAPLGTSLTEEQIQVLWKLIPDDEKKPVICFDGDEAGRRAAARACERVLPLLRPGYTVLFSFLPEGEDPDTLIRSSGGKSFKAVIDNAMPLADYLWMHHASQRDLSTPEGRAGFGDALEKEVLRIADRSVQSFYRQEFRRRISEKFFSGRTTGKSHGPERIVRVHKPSYKVEDLHRKILLSTIINHPGILEFCEDEFMSLDFVDNELIEIQKNIVDIWNNNIGVDSAELKNTLYEKGFKEILDKVLSGSIYIHAGFARPESTGEKALEGWRHFIEMMHRNNLLREQKEAGAVLAVDTTEENESRMLAFYNMHKAGDAH
jgi:DNA primase